jgi:hypothetical protein
MHAEEFGRSTPTEAWAEKMLGFDGNLLEKMFPFFVIKKPGEMMGFTVMVV